MLDITFTLQTAFSPMMRFDRTSMARLAIIIVSYNVRQLLRGCLRAVMNSQRAPDVAWDIWVIDNASADGSAAMVMEEFPDVHCIASTDNLGFARGNNTVLRQLGFADAPHTNPGNAGPDLVLLLNPDTAVAPDAINIMADFLLAHPAAGGCGAQLNYGNGQFQHGAFAFPGLWQLIFDWVPPPGRVQASRLNGRYPRAWYAAGEPFAIDFALGAALMLRRAAIEAAGLLDEAYFMYCEEVDWCWRLQQAGWPLWCVPQARVTHYEGQSTRQFREQMVLALWRSRLRLYEKHYGALRYWMARHLVRLGARLEMNRCRRAAHAGRLDADELAHRLATYRHITQLTKV